MARVEGREDLADYYDRPGVIEDYIEQRFADPVGRLLHENQVARVNGLIAENGVTMALEIAPGPGRITAGVRGLRAGLAVDTSLAMISIATGEVLDTGVPWAFVRGSGFALPLRDGSIPFAFSFRFLRHLRRGERARVLRELRRVLQPGGGFLFDAPNARVERPYRTLVGYDRFPVYDELWTKEALVGELEAAGLRVASMDGNVRHFFTQSLAAKLMARMGMPRAADASVRALEALNVGEPFEWLVLCVSP